MREGISVIVCCYNSEKRIAETLRFLAEQKVSASLSWEVIVVNNASTDHTREVALKSWNSNASAISFQVIDQPLPGLARSRQKGIEVSQYDSVIFCDDDNHFDTNYVSRAFSLLKAHDDAGIIGGWVRPKLPLHPRSWIEDFYPALAIGKQAEQDSYVEWVFGAGMVIRKKVFSILEERNIRLLLSDRVGTKQTSGGDAEMCMATCFVGLKIFYSNSLILDHNISANRLTKKSFIKGNYRNVFPVVYLYLMNRLMNDRSADQGTLYTACFRERISLIFHFIPRMLLGKHKFYSFIMLFQNVQLFYWLLTRKARFEQTYHQIKSNLYSWRKVG
jgi:glycosyltransferase involved in cell wall biosynthesis